MPIYRQRHERCSIALVERLFISPEPLPVGSRIACRIEYDGSQYNGWQSQPHPGVRTIQDELERALSDVAAAPVRVHCAGRTDSGVHGFAQIVHFETPSVRSCKAWALGANARDRKSVV